MEINSSKRTVHKDYKLIRNKHNKISASDFFLDDR